MKRIDTVIRKRCMEEVRARLQDAGVEGLTVTEAQGFGSQARSSDVYRGVQYTIEFSPALWVTVVVRDEQVEDVLSAIITGARTGHGQHGDGNIYVTRLDEAVRIRTGERTRSDSVHSEAGSAKGPQRTIDVV